MDHHLAPEGFNTTRDRTITQRWQNYLIKMGRYFVMTKTDTPESKQACLLYYGGDDLSNVFETLKDKLILRNPDNAAEINVYDATVTVLTKHFASGDSVTYERSNFRSTRQQDGESVTDYITRLRKKAAFCKFTEYSVEAAIVDQFIEHCASNTLRIKLLATNDLTLDTTVNRSIS